MNGIQGQSMPMTRHKNLWLSLESAVFMAFLIGLYFPSEIFWTNRVEFSIGFAELLPPLLLIFIGLSLALFLLIAVGTRLLGSSLALAVLVISILMWVEGSFLYPELGSLNGRKLELDFLSATTIIEITLLSLAAVIAIWYSSSNSGKLLSVSRPLAVILLLKVIMQPVAHAFSDEQAEAHRSNWFSTYHDELLEFSTRGNILQVVFDELQDNILEEALAQRPELERELTGFTLYTDTLANFSNTLMSVSSMLGGKSYQQGDSREQYFEREVGRSEYLGALQQTGYRTDFTTLPHFCIDAKLANCSPIPSAARNIKVASLIDFSLFRVAPDILKPLIYNEGYWLTTLWFYDTSMIKLQPLNAVPLFDSFVAGLSVGDTKPRYKLFHTLLTHGPTVIDASCQEVKAPEKALKSARVAQTLCALDKLRDLLSKLKSLGVYDNTLIILSSDHGSDHPPKQVEAALRKNKLHPMAYARARAILLIKPRGETGPLLRSARPVQLKDIPNTVLGSLGQNYLGEGIDILPGPAQTGRVRVYHYLGFSHFPDPDLLSRQPRYEITGSADNPDNWRELDK